MVHFWNREEKKGGYLLAPLSVTYLPTLSPNFFSQMIRSQQTPHKSDYGDQSYSISTLVILQEQNREWKQNVGAKQRKGSVQKVQQH